MKTKVEFGDWQTNEALSLEVCRLLYQQGVRPQILLEPTCGRGSFIKAALQIFDTIEMVYGIDINPTYVEEISQWATNYPNKGITFHFYCHNFFDYDFSSLAKLTQNKNLLILGNPPWVTNSELGRFNSDNLPTKVNFKKMRGLEAMTGKSNFDIGEYITHRLLLLFGQCSGHIALLLKNSVIKNIISSQSCYPYNIDHIHQYEFDAKKEFNASVAASLFFARLSKVKAVNCSLHNLYTKFHIRDYGWCDGHFVSDLSLYKETLSLDGLSPFEWRSGIKHDCAKVMELELNNGSYYNGLGEIVDVEEDRIFPLVKSSDLKNTLIDSTKRYVVVTQLSTNEDTSFLQVTHPKLYRYLESHSEYFDRRASSIYKKGSRFGIFGIGSYSFKPYKVIVSSLYKNILFVVTPTIDGKPFMADDTCYMIGFDDLSTAMEIADELNSEKVKKFIYSIVFEDSKRIVNKETLMRIKLTSNRAITNSHKVKPDILNNHLQYSLFSEL